MQKNFRQHGVEQQPLVLRERRRVRRLACVRSLCHPNSLSLSMGSSHTHFSRDSVLAHSRPLGLHVLSVSAPRLAQMNCSRCVRCRARSRARWRARPAPCPAPPPIRGRALHRHGAGEDRHPAGRPRIRPRTAAAAMAGVEHAAARLSRVLEMGHVVGRVFRGHGVGMQLARFVVPASFMFGDAGAL